MSRGGPWPHCREGMSVVQILGSFQENERQFQLTWCVIIREKYFYCIFVEPRGIFCEVSYWVTLNSLWINPLFIWTALQDFKTSTIKSEINDHKNIKYTCSLVCSTAHHSSASSALCLWVTFGEWHSGCQDGKNVTFAFPLDYFPATVLLTVTLVSVTIFPIKCPSPESLATDQSPSPWVLSSVFVLV